MRHFAGLAGGLGIWLNIGSLALKGAGDKLVNRSFLFAPDGGIAAMITDMACPNGLAFSPDESRLYVADTGRMFSSDPQHIRVYDMVGGKPRNGRIFHKVSAGCADGIRVDGDGNLWSSAGDGVHCIAPDGHLMGRILVPEVVSNICFGGRAKHRLFITATTSLYSVILNRGGVQWP